MNQMADDKMIFKGECQLAGWNSSYEGGLELTLWVQDQDEAERVKQMTARRDKAAGQRLMVVMAQVGDDEKPVPQVNPLAEKSESKPRAKLLALWRANAEFQQWFFREHPELLKQAMDKIVGGSDFELTKEMLYLHFGVTSLSDIDRGWPHRGIRFMDLKDHFMSRVQTY